MVTCLGSGNSSSSGGGTDNSTDNIVLEIAEKILLNVPHQYDLRKAHILTFKKIDNTMNSLGVFLGQELIRFNGLIEVMLNTLKELKRAIKGEVVMSNELEIMYNCFIYQKVPIIWENSGYPCLKPLPSWVEDFIERISFMSVWLLHGPRPAYWLSGFFFPQGFMTAVKQTHSREHKIAVDTLMIGCEMTSKNSEDITIPPTTGAYVYGLFMEGGRFNRITEKLEDSTPRKLLDPMPCILLRPVITVDYTPTSCYNCPLYKTSIRAGTLSTTGHSTNFVVALPIPSDKDEDHFVRRGCAMLCMTDE